MAAAFEVYNELGSGLLEEVYQESLEIELELRGMPFKAKQELKLFYKGRLLRKRYIPDLYAHDSIIVELKALSALTSEHEAQILNYLHIAKCPVGYLINFGHPKKLQWKRFVLSQYAEGEVR